MTKAKMILVPANKPKGNKGSYVEQTDGEICTFFEDYHGTVWYRKNYKKLTTALKKLDKWIDQPA